MKIKQRHKMFSWSKNIALVLKRLRRAQKYVYSKNPYLTVDL